jgi:hypothetical protein
MCKEPKPTELRPSKPVAPAIPQVHRDHDAAWAEYWRDLSKWQKDEIDRLLQGIEALKTIRIELMHRIEANAHETFVQLVPSNPVAQALTELVRLKGIKEAWDRVPQIQHFTDPRMPQFEKAERDYFDDYKVNRDKAWQAARDALKGMPTPCAQPFSGTCYMLCEQHKGRTWFSMASVSYSPPPKVVCPICEPPAQKASEVLPAAERERLKEFAKAHDDPDMYNQLNGGEQHGEG